MISHLIERFSFERRKVIGFAFTTLPDWLKKLAPLFHPIRSKTKTNRDSLVRVASAACNYFVFWLVHLIICFLCDWLEWLLWFWFYDTQLETALRSLYSLSVCYVLCVFIAQNSIFCSISFAKHLEQIWVGVIIACIYIVVNIVRLINWHLKTRSLRNQYQFELI